MCNKLGEKEIFFVRGIFFLAGEGKSDFRGRVQRVCRSMKVVLTMDHPWEKQNKEVANYNMKFRRASENP